MAVVVLPVRDESLDGVLCVMAGLVLASLPLLAVAWYLLYFAYVAGWLGC